MGEITELQAYKQLLQLTENLINSLAPGEELLRKYQTLKKSILSKVNPYSTNHSSQSYNSKISTTYKQVVQQLLEGLGYFQAQIEGQMNRSSFLKNSKKVIQNINKESRILNDELTRISESSKNLKLLLKEQSNACQYVVKQIEGKIENMGLMIEVHRKMHQIIMEASDKETKRMKKQQQNQRRMEQLESIVEEVKNVDQFMESYDITQKKARKFELARKNLAKVLFDL